MSTTIEASNLGGLLSVTDDAKLPTYQPAGCPTVSFNGAGGRPATTGSGGKRGVTTVRAERLFRYRSAAANSDRPAMGSLAEAGIPRSAVRTLKPYSAPLYLHSTLFPPKNHDQPAGKESQVNGGANYRKGRGNEWRKSLGTTVVPAIVATEAAPHRHRQSGYLHRYMGFQQEEVSHPPVTSFRVLGGLGEGLRKPSKAPAVRPNPEHGKPAARVNPGRSEGPAAPRPGIVVVPSGSTASWCRSEGTRSVTCGTSDASTVHEDACPLGLFADGSKVAPIFPPNVGVQVPVWCGRNKERPRGAKRSSSWGADGWGMLNANENTADRSAIFTKGTTRKSGARGIRSDEDRSSTCSAFLPYYLERPVSPERAQSFFFTCN